MRPAGAPRGDRGAQRRLAGIVLAAFLLRALVPEGFMPSSSRAFALEICPEGLPVQILSRLAQGAPAAARHAHAPLQPDAAAHDHVSGGGNGPPRDAGPSAPAGSLLFHDCSFGASPAAAPTPAPSVAVAYTATALAVTASPPPLQRAAPRYRPQQARAPPALS